MVTPTLTITMTKRSSAPRFRVRIKQMDTGCTEELWLDDTTSSATSMTKTFQLPFGRYKVCVDDGNNRHRVSTAFNAVDAVDASTNTPSHHRLTPEPGVPLQQSDAMTLTDPPSNSYSSGTCPSGF